VLYYLIYIYIYMLVTSARNASRAPAALSSSCVGALPQDDEYEDERLGEDESGNERSDDDDDDDDDDSGEWVSESDEEEPEWGWRVSPLSEGNGRTMELTCLLEECRVMNEGRDEEMIAQIRWIWLSWRRLWR
jgi:hypothetical protein